MRQDWQMGACSKTSKQGRAHANAKTSKQGVQWRVSQQARLPCTNYLPFLRRKRHATLTLTDGVSAPQEKCRPRLCGVGAAEFPVQRSTRYEKVYLFIMLVSAH